MNANELADWLIAYMVDDDDYEEKYMEQIVTMLRQQQAEIEALKQQLNPPKSTNLGPWQWK